MANIAYPEEPYTRIEAYLDKIHEAITSSTAATARAQAVSSFSSPIARFSTSDVSSTFSGESTELYRENLLGDNDPGVGSIAIFPDNKSLVLYMGDVKEVNEETYTVGDIEYLNSIWQPSGEWIKGIIANYPELYRYKGASWICLGRDIQTEPTEEGREWFLLCEAPPRPVYFKLNGASLTDVGGIGEKYTVAISNLTPITPKPEIGDTVMFATDSATYVGQITEAQEAAVIVEVKLGMNGVPNE